MQRRQPGPLAAFALTGLPLATSVEQVGTLECGHGMPYESQRPVFVCRGLKLPLETLWPQLKHYD
jgi:hypothetical protein